MMYAEFINGTGCKDNEHNYKVYKNLEIMYMNSDMSKSEIYEYGKKLVDNSKSEEQIKLENELNAKIEEHKGFIKQYKESIEFYKAVNDKQSVKFYQESIKYSRRMIKDLKFVLQC